ncbi:MAG: GAF domain-containing protein [Neomegalonema sp.]|nr:GAF domain-containing protein [Neomegalonema sp.]
MANHALKVWRAVEARDDVSPHAASWRRCVNLHGLDPSLHRPPQRLGEPDLRAAREQSGRLIRAAAPELDRLFVTFSRAGCCIVLADNSGFVLDRRGVVADDDHFRRLDLWDGAQWDEAGVGTNGIGTAIADERPVAIHRDKHFLSSNASLSCAAAPIRDERGRVAGVVDFSSCRYDTTEALLGVLLQTAREAATRIETTMFKDAFAGLRIMLTEGVNGQPGLLALDRDEIVVGANAAARRRFRIDDSFLALERPVADLLGDGAEPVGDGFEAAERRTIRVALARAGGNVSYAAKLLGVSRATLHRKIKRLNIRDHRKSSADLSQI